MKSSVNEKPVVASMFESTTTISVSFNNEKQPRLVVPQPGAKDNLVPVQVRLLVCWRALRADCRCPGLSSHQARKQEKDQLSPMALQRRLSTSEPECVCAVGCWNEAGSFGDLST